MTTPDQPMQGSTADYCSAFPGEPHAINTYLGRSELYVRQCSLCGWIDFADLQQQAEAQQAAGRRQATEGWERRLSWRHGSGTRWEFPHESYVAAYAKAQRRMERQYGHAPGELQQRLVGPWEPAEQPEEGKG